MSDVRYINTFGHVLEGAVADPPVHPMTELQDVALDHAVRFSVLTVSRGEADCNLELRWASKDGGTGGVALPNSLLFRLVEAVIQTADMAGKDNQAEADRADRELDGRQVFVFAYPAACLMSSRLRGREP